MNNKQSMLIALIPVVGELLANCFVSPDQTERWEDFCNDIVVTGEEELSFQNTTLAKFKEIEQARGARIKSQRDAELLNVRQISKLFGGNIGLKAIIKLLKSGEIPAIEVGEGRMLLALKEDVTYWMKHRKLQPIQGILNSCPVGYKKKSLDRVKAS